MEGVIGAFEGTHIPIIGQQQYNENYINRKGFLSIILQGVCDHNIKFTDCFAGWPGSVQDAERKRKKIVTTLKTFYVLFKKNYT